MHFWAVIFVEVTHKSMILSPVMIKIISIDILALIFEWKCLVWYRFCIVHWLPDPGPFEVCSEYDILNRPPRKIVSSGNQFWAQNQDHTKCTWYWNNRDSRYVIFPKYILAITSTGPWFQDLEYLINRVSTVDVARLFLKKYNLATSTVRPRFLPLF